MFTGATAIKLLVKKGTDGYNKHTFVVVCFPREAMHECDIDEYCGVSDETSWFRTVNITDIDFARSFSANSYVGFLGEEDYTIATTMYSTLVDNYRSQSNVPSWFLRGINPPYLLTLNPKVINQENSTCEENLKTAETESDDNTTRRKRKKTKIYDPQTVIEEEKKAKMRKGSISSSKIDPGKKSKKPRMVESGEYRRENLTSEDIFFDQEPEQGTIKTKYIEKSLIK